MAYADLLDRENISSQYLAVINPRRQITDTWTNLVATRYSVSFDYGYVNELRVDDEAKTKASDFTLSDGDWFYDTEDELIYFDDGSDPNSVGFFTASYELYVGTFDAYFNRDPSDSTTGVVYFEPLIVKAPPIFQNISDNLFGFLPSGTSPFILSTVTGFFLRHVYDSSFNQAPVKVYHYLGDLTAANIKQVVNGRCGNIKYNDQTMDLTIYDSNQIFDTFFRNFTGESFYTTSDFPNLDPNFLARPIRSCYGIVEGFVPVNVDYEFDSPTTSNNREWVCINPAGAGTFRNFFVAASPASTATRTYLSGSLAGLTVGDSVHLNSSLGPASDEYPIVTAVGANYIEHAAITNTAIFGDFVQRAFVAKVTIVQDGITYIARYQRDYEISFDVPTNSAGFTFFSSLEANLGMSRTLSVNDAVFCKIYGTRGLPTLGAGFFGSESAVTGNVTNPAVIVYKILKEYLGLSEDDLNLPSFTALEASITGEIGFAIPRFATSNFPKYRDLLGDIFQSELLKISYDDDNKFKLEQTAPFSVTDKTIGDDEILAGSINFSYFYTDVISDAIVEYAGSEVNNRNEIAAELSVKSVRTVSSVAKNLHKIKKERTFKSLHMFESDASNLADRLSYALGDRRGVAAFKTKNRFFDTEIDDRIDVVREKVPGFSYLRGTDRTVSGAVISSTKTLDDINIEIDDQKGIQDNEGSW